MKDLTGSEGNAIALNTEDLNDSFIKPFYTVYVLSGSTWSMVSRDDIVSIDLNFQGSAIDGVTASSCDITLEDKDGKYDPINGPSGWVFSLRRKIKVYIGVKVDRNSDGIRETPYTWPYFQGFICSPVRRKSPDGATFTVRAIDPTDGLSRYSFPKDSYWGSITTITANGSYEYSLPAGCKGIYDVLLDGVKYSSWTYDWVTGKLVITQDLPSGTLTVKYFTSANIITVLQNILVNAKVIASSGDLLYDNPSKTIDRCWFNEGTSGLEAVKKLCQLVNYRFWFDGDGKANFKAIQSIGTGVFDITDDNANILETRADDAEFFNGVEVIGEERKRKEYFTEEATLGTVNGTLDAETVSEEHNVLFTGYEKIRYELTMANKSGVTTEIDRTETGAKVSILHDPSKSLNDVKTQIGQYSGNVNNGQEITINFITGKTFYKISFDFDYADQKGGLEPVYSLYFYSGSYLLRVITSEMLPPGPWCDYSVVLEEKPYNPGGGFSTLGSGSQLIYAGNTVTKTFDGHSDNVFADYSFKTTSIPAHVSCEVQRVAGGLVVRFINHGETSGTVYYSYYGIYRAYNGTYSIVYEDDDEVQIAFEVNRGVGSSLFYWKGKIYARKKAYNAKFIQTYLDGVSAKYLVRTDRDGMPLIATAYGYECIPRSYSIKVFGRKHTPELESKIYSLKKLGDATILAQGGASYLTINNHLVQSQSDADTIAQNLLAHYQKYVNRVTVETISPAPLEVGDTVAFFTSI